MAHSVFPDRIHSLFLKGSDTINAEDETMRMDLSFMLLWACVFLLNCFVADLPEWELKVRR